MPEMRLWLLKDDNPEWDSAEGYVIRALTPRIARQVATDGGGVDPEKWLNARVTSCKEVRVDDKMSVVLQAFHAG